MREAASLRNEENVMTTVAKFLTDGDGEVVDVLGSAITFLATGADPAGTYEVVVVEATSGGEPIPHRHPWQEFYLVLEGTMEVQVGGRRHQAAAGSFITIPPR